MSLPGKDIGFVGVQLILFVGYVFDVVGKVALPLWLRVSGAGVAIIGVLVVLVALLQLNGDLSPFPTPKSGSSLRTNGVYAVVRHPIYSGILLLTAGYGIYQQSPMKLIITGGLVILFYLKSKYEELLLKDVFSDYDMYMKRTGRLLPKVHKR